MQIQPINNYHTNFKANFYTVEKRGKYYSLDRISTDNAEKLGEKPVLRSSIDDFPMTYDGKYYTTKVPSYLENYRIYYSDTGKYEKNGEEQKINPTKLKDIAIIEDRKFNKLPQEYSFAKGEASGKVFVNTFDVPKDIPVILILDEIKDEQTLILNIPDNVKGVITASCNYDILSHAANLTRNKISVMSIIWDKDKLESLKSDVGKYIYINNEDGVLEYKEIEPDLAKVESKLVKKIEVPKLENVERLLNFNELTPQNCGNKGYRLSVMQKLVEEGKLKDIQIPKGFVIPEGYIKKYREYIDIEDEEESYNRIRDGIYTNDTEDKVVEMGLPRRSLIIRSNFNTEDLGSFSSAGIYLSDSAGQSRNVGNLILEAHEITNLSLDEELNPIAKKTHEKYGIQEKDVQPSVIIQDRIHSDYNFTVYSDDGDNNMIIDFSDFKLGYLNPGNALIKYNKKTKELKIERNQSPIAEYIFDENGKIIDQKHPIDRINKNWDVLTSLLGIVTSGALVLEKFFKHPQDIEGGITKDGKVYFWQTRDIVAKAVKGI